MMTQPQIPAPALIRTAALVAALGMAGCSVPDEPVDIHDPYEPMNRASHAFNKGADTVLFRPASQVYGKLVPERGRRALSNAADNLDTPTSVVNYVLQGDGEKAIKNTFRFLINTTVGVFGLFDPASDFGLERDQTGFGETLAVWGAQEGAYQELLVLGPSTERDTVGFAVDLMINPIGTILGDNGREIAAATSVPSVLNSRYEYASTLDSVLYDSADSYAQLRLFYLDNRRFELGGQTSAGNAFDPYENLYDDVYKGLYDEIK